MSDKITLVELVQLRYQYEGLGGDPHALDDDIENAKEDGLGTLSLADHKIELGYCQSSGTPTHLTGDDCRKFECDNWLDRD